MEAQISTQGESINLTANSVNDITKNINHDGITTIEMLLTPEKAFDSYKLSKLTYKDEAGIKAAGKIRQEGKEYIVQDGDVLFFKFNV